MMVASPTTLPLSVLAEVTRDRMTASTRNLVILDPDTGEWGHVSWPEVHRRAEEIAATLLAEAVDDTPPVVALFGHPTVDLAAAVQGTWLAGGAISILPGPVRGANEDRWSETTIRRLAELGTTRVLANGEQLALLADSDGCPALAPLATYGVGAIVDGPVGRRVDDRAPAVLQGTAGSTGEPKTAVLSTRAVLNNSRHLAQKFDAREERDVVFSWLPMYHDMGLAFLVATMVTGVEFWVVPNSTFAAQPFKWLTWLTESKATFTGAPDFAYALVGRFGHVFKSADLSHLRVAISGGEPIDPDGYDRFIDGMDRFDFAPAAAAPAYGMAEATCAVTMPDGGEGVRYDEVTVTPPEPGAEPRVRRYPLLGTPLEGMEVRIVPAPDHAPVIDDRRVGLVEIRGTSMMNGYLGQEPLAPDEWFPTGDIGYLVDGRLVVCGRAKELVIVAGRNLFPVEIERAVATVPGVRGGRVAAMGCGEGSNRPGLAIVAEYKGRKPDAARSAIMSAVASETGVVPSDVVLVGSGSLPITTSGKLRRLAIRDLLESGSLDEVGVAT
ncbi:MAG: long-chain-fatty acid--ACP ligase MbtM [Actinomycetota bacterium]